MTDMCISYLTINNILFNLNLFFFLLNLRDVFQIIENNKIRSYHDKIYHGSFYEQISNNDSH